ncbi:hypothetical protein [Bradyrhizobium sp. OK095]|uniref:hypothetical protein n=1 Tax=Bradyrhizobium sp. OK095 TaxID=1882760 RepID=UPI0008D526BE|nr:hypothetical protein [Bradyrhizobium sp. OK095]SEN67087.1 hypothetical protein SAMN05443254_11030 [Bradyrhizobium sp. OK095]
MRRSKKLLFLSSALIALTVSVFVPPALGFDTASWPINPTIRDPGGLTLATGDAGISPEALFDLQSPARVSPGIQYWVGAPGSSPAPSDSNNGLSPATPLASMTKAIQLANASGQSSARVNVMAGEYFRALGPAGTVPTIDIAFVAYGGRVVTGTFDNFSTFTLDATYTNCYSLALTSIDRVGNRLAKSGFATYGVQTNTDHSKLADPATLQATAPTTSDLWATDATKIYIRRVDGAVPTPTNTRIYRSGVFLFYFNQAVNVYVEGIDAEGASSAATFDYRLSAQSALKRVFVAKNCSAKYAGGVVNTTSRGFGIESMKGLAYLYGCEGSACATDGINFHDALASGLQWLTVNCSGTDNGRGTSQSDNGLTAHELCIGMDLGGYYPNNRGGSVRCVNGSKTLCAGTWSSDLGDVAMGGAITSVTFQTDNTAIMWCFRCKPNFNVLNAAYIDYNASTGTVIHLCQPHANAGTHGGGGTIDTYAG